MKKIIPFFLFLTLTFSIQISSISSKEITLKTGENATVSIVVVNDRPYSIECILSYIGSLAYYSPPRTTLKPYETKTFYLTLSVPENYSGENPSKGYVVVSEKTEGIVSSALLNQITVIVPNAEERKGEELANIAEQIKASLEKRMENESIVVIPSFSIHPLSPQTYLLLTFPKVPRPQTSQFIFFALSFFITSFAIFFIFNEIVKEHGKV
ncbi:MAG: hypothetical protein QXY05_02645 [Candidatus Anstonellales archaeon]